MKYVYPACFYPDSDGGYTVEFPAFPVASYGNDLPEAMSMGQEAAAGRIHAMIKDGEQLPTAGTIADTTLDRPDGFVSMVCIDMDLYAHLFDDKPIKKTLTIPSWLNAAAEARNINFSAILKDALTKRLTEAQ